MYLQFYSLRDIPFSLTPDPRFLYFTASHREVMANLHYGIQHGKGLIVATGEVGTGKTTLLRAMLARLDRSVLSSYIFNPGLTVPEVYQHLAADFGLGNYSSKSDLLMKLGRLLVTRHSRGLRTVLVVDEAQGLSRELLEEIRLLLNFETYTEKQLQIILTGQPELRQLLNSPDLRQLKQRISLRCEIKPLKADEISPYIRTRLKVAGAVRQDLFTADAVGMIFRASEGIPRLVNNICDNALLTGYATNTRTITAEIIAEVSEALDLLQPMIEADPRETMQSSLPPLPVVREPAEEDWANEVIAETARGRRRSQGNSRRRPSRRDNRPQNLSLLQNESGETTQFKVISSSADDAL
jgi:general secretion pathway protein A